MLHKLNKKISFGLTLAMLVALLLAPLALADNVLNDVVVGGTDTFTLGASTIINYRIQQTGAGNDGQAGCNAADGSAATVSINTPANVTATPNPLTFTDCGVINAQAVKFTATAPGNYLITVSVSDTGAGTYNTSQATVTLHVLPPPDDTEPVITPNVVGTPGNNGWYTSDVTVSWSVVDNESAISSTSGCGPALINYDTAGTILTCTATSAGGTISESVTIKRDATAPTISGSSSPAANANGWNNTDVNVSFTCDDNFSGVASCGLDQILSSEGADQTATGTAVDSAGNSASITVSGINIDKTAPSTTSDAPENWVNSDVTINLSPNDNLSGIANTHYQLDGGVQQSGTSVGINTEGVHTLKFWSVDVAGNVEAAKTVEVKIDKTAPEIALVSRTPLANGYGWNNTDVTVSWSCTDAESGVVAPELTQTVSAEGANQSATGTCVDNAGNTAPDTVSGISIDKTAPTITGAPDRAANGNGWYNADVTVTFTCADEISGVASCPDLTVLSEGANQNVDGTATDKAGNSASFTVSGINIDKTKPTFTPTLSPAAPASTGWYNISAGAPIVSFECNDALSGLDSICPLDYTFGEGADQSYSVTIFDQAGNSASAGVSGINVDLTIPTITASLSPAASSTGWYNIDTGAPTVSFTCEDETSGVDGACPSAYTFGQGANQSYQKTIYDIAGNSASAGVSNINVDLNAPTVTGAATTLPNANGWYKGSVTVRFTCIDTLSGIATCPDDVVLVEEGENQSVTRTATDNAGNSASATVNNINIDLTIPTNINFVGGPEDGASYYFGSVPEKPTCTAEDVLSGLASCVVTGHSTAVGTHILTATATDYAGNTANNTRSYTVLAWTLTGFYRPVDMTPAGSATVWNIVKGGSTVPLKFNVFAGPTELTDTSMVSALTAKSVACTGGSEEDVEMTATGGTELRYDWTEGQFVYNWKTPKMPGKCYQVMMVADDGSQITASFRLK